MPTPLSRLDLPRIVEAVRWLYSAIERPSETGWQPPAWLVAQFEQTTAGAETLHRVIAPNIGQAGLIHYAATEVLNRLMPPWYHRRDDCPEITESLLDPRQKVSLLQLRDWLNQFALAQELARNRSAALQSLAYLEVVLEALTGQEQANSGDGSNNPMEQMKAGRPILNPQQQAVLDLLKELPSGKAMTGAKIINALANRKPKIITTQTILTARIMPTLKAHYGIRNDRNGCGYYVAAE